MGFRRVGSSDPAQDAQVCINGSGTCRDAIAADDSNRLNWRCYLLLRLGLERINPKP